MEGSQRPAIAGGQPAFSSGPPRWPPADERIRNALDQVWADGSWGSYDGPYCERLEAALCNFHAVKHAYCCSSGTLAVELALRGLRIGKDDEVILAGYDFPGNFRAIEATGARPLLIDIGPGSWGISIESLSGVDLGRVRAIIVSHLHGWLAPIEEIAGWAHDRGIRVVEDACQAHGAMINGRMAGSLGDVGVLSFGGSKLMTAGRGGAVLTNDTKIYQRLKVHCEQGNHAYPLSQLQAAVLLPQLETLADRNRKRRYAADFLFDAIAEIPGLMPVRSQRPGWEPSYYKLGWFYDPAKFGQASRDEFIRAARAEGLSLGPGFSSFSQRSPKRCRKAGSLSNSERAGENSLLLYHPILLEDEKTLQRANEAIKRLARYFAKT